MVNMILCTPVVCITILCNNVSFYRYRVSQEDGSMPCDRPVNVLLYLNLHRHDLAVAHRGAGLVCYSVMYLNIKVRVGSFTRFRCRILAIFVN